MHSCASPWRAHRLLNPCTHIHSQGTYTRLQRDHHTNSTCVQQDHLCNVQHAHAHAPENTRVQWTHAQAYASRHGAHMGTQGTRACTAYHHPPAWGGTPSAPPPAPTTPDWGQLSGTVPGHPGYSRRARVPLCQDRVQAEGRSDQTPTWQGLGLAFGAARRQAGARRAMTAVTWLPPIPALPVHRGWPCKADSAQGPQGPVCRMLPPSPWGPQRGSPDPGGPLSREAGGGWGHREPMGTGPRLPHRRARLPRLPHTAVAHPSRSLWA